MNDETKRKPGRPRKNSGPLPWDEIDSLLVHGEAVSTEHGDVHSYPTFRELAKRFNVSHALIGAYSKQHNCMRRRKQMKKRVKELADVKLAEMRADELALRRDDLVRTIERFLVQFEEAVVEGRVRCDNPADFNTMVRLRAFILGDADARAQLIGGITLEDLERGHKEMLDALNDATPEMRGEVIRIAPVEPKPNGDGANQDDARQ